ncbi:ATP-binding protein [Halalkalibacter urbisdiaboli]|uniref:ATP-binding protein n=1 Tax=Halalkalibacter urbisdiaboli TaxID=1960589 RepID=UPI0013FE4C86|nr:ATP-binding protein [Halalkalibacter urbisdiaboli]
MKLKTLKLQNFRSYKEETVINLDELTAIVGKNDIGKSTILEALEIFFNNQTVKIEQADACVFSGQSLVKITCIFTDLPDRIVLDTSSETSLQDEFLLNSEEQLEISKVFDCSKKTPTIKVFANANHPSIPPMNTLLEQTNTKLKQLLNTLDIPSDEVDTRSNVSLRKAIWQSSDDLFLEETLIDLSKADAKSIWEQIERHMPIYALFQSDRSSSDSDNEVQDPMKIAVKQAIDSVKDQLEEIKKHVEKDVIDVATKTLAKLHEMDESLASQLTPQFKEEPKWNGLFKLSLEGDDNIPINKRGSGVRRLILLNFFRAEAERRKNETLKKNIIYAIEEPETAQHPSNQILLAEAFKQLVDNDSAQILLTTHVPAFAELMPEKSLRFIDVVNGVKVINDPSDETVSKIADALGVYPSLVTKEEQKVLVCVEGVHDVTALSDFSQIISSERPELVNLYTDSRVVVMPLGGSTLKGWVQHRYLKKLGFPEIHIYDRDDIDKPKYRAYCEQVNLRTDGSRAFLTNKREMENYIHPEAIQKVFDVSIQQDDWLDVPLEIAEVQHSNNPDSKPWCDVSQEKRKQKEGKVKLRLNNEAIKTMTYEQVCEIDSGKEIEMWLTTITKLCNESSVITK